LHGSITPQAVDKTTHFFQQSKALPAWQEIVRDREQKRGEMPRGGVRSDEANRCNESQVFSGQISLRLHGVVSERPSGKMHSNLDL
jgi:hypothetical protein